MVHTMRFTLPSDVGEIQEVQSFQMAVLMIGCHALDFDKVNKELV